jgi:hypothetical protein
MTSFFALLRVLSHSATVAGIARVKEIVARSRQGYIELVVEALLITIFLLKERAGLIDTGNMIAVSSYLFHRSAGPA